MVSLRPTVQVGEVIVACQVGRAIDSTISVAVANKGCAWAPIVAMNRSSLAHGCSSYVLVVPK